jgi:hypothetical protein
MSFEKIYILFSKKKKNINFFIYMFLIYILGIPFRFVKLVYYFTFKNNDSFRENIEYLYINKYHQLRELKIEIYENEILLNCYTLSKLILRLNMSHLTNEQKLDALIKLRKIASSLHKHEDIHKQFVKMYLSTIDNTSKIPHYTYIEGYNSIHATSNSPTKISNNQSYDIPIPSLIKKGAQNPKSIITEKGTFKESSKYKFVNVYELDSLKFSHKEKFNLNNMSFKYM